MKVDFSKVVDLSQRMIPGDEHFPLEIVPKQIEEFFPNAKRRLDIQHVLTDIKVNSHCGTHIEFSLHHWPEGAAAADFPLSRLIAPAVVMDFSHKKVDEFITLEDVKHYEGKIQKGDMIFLRTDMDQNYRKENWADWVQITEEATHWLMEFNPCVIGTDAIGFEIRGTDYQPIHQIISPHADVAMVESVTNLKEIQDCRALVFILAWPVEGLDACPARIIAIKDGGIIS